MFVYNFWKGRLVEARSRSLYKCALVVLLACLEEAETDIQVWRNSRVSFISAGEEKVNWRRSSGYVKKETFGGRLERKQC